MHTQLYGDGISVDWTEGEWERLQAIKAKHFDNPDWTPPVRKATGVENQRISVALSPLLISRVHEYMGKHDISLSVMIRTILDVILD